MSPLLLAVVAYWGLCWRFRNEQHWRGVEWRSYRRPHHLRDYRQGMRHWRRRMEQVRSLWGVL